MKTFTEWLKLRKYGVDAGTSDAIALAKKSLGISTNEWFIFENYDASHALIVVDVQNDFVNGSLPVPGAKEIIPYVNNLANNIRNSGGIVVYTADLHPANHVSFKGQGGQWPSHCVVNTFGSQFVPDLEVNGPIFDKATEPDKDSYSGFGGKLRSQKPTTLETYLKEHNVTNVIVCGLALDYCVLATATDSKKHGFNTTVYLPGSRAVNNKEIETLIAKIKQQGIKIIAT